MGLDPLSIAILAINAYGTSKAIKSQKEAARFQTQAAAQQQEAYKAEQRRTEVQNIRTLRQQIRQSRLAKGSMIGSAAVSGGLGSSGLAGGLASIGSQTAGNVNYLANVARENTAISNAQIASAGLMSQATSSQAEGAIWGQIGSLAGTIFQNMYVPSSSLSSFTDKAGPINSGSIGQRTITGGR